MTAIINRRKERQDLQRVTREIDDEPPPPTIVTHPQTRIIFEPMEEEEGEEANINQDPQETIPETSRNARRAAEPVTPMDTQTSTLPTRPPVAPSASQNYSGLLM